MTKAGFSSGFAAHRATLLLNSTLLIALMALLVGFAAIQPAVLSPDNLLNIAQQASYLAIFSMAQMVVILTRGLDLAISSTVSMISVSAALAMASAVTAGWDAISVLLIGLAVGIALGAVVGAINGVVVAYFGVSPFVVTLGSYNITFGIATMLTNGHPIQGVPELFSRLLYAGSLFGVPAAVAIATLSAIGLHLLLTKTVYGRAIYIIGSNRRSAIVAGLPVKRLLVATYILCSVLAALGALMMTARTGSGEPNLGGALTLQAIAAAVVGGTSLAGGRGGVGTAIVGALFITVLSNGLNLARIDGYVQMVALGTIIIVGVVLDRLRVQLR